MSDEPQPPRHHRDGRGGGIFWGLVLLAVGAYFLLTETLDVALPELGQFWPLLVILLGGWILFRGLTERR